MRLPPIVLTSLSMLFGLPAARAQELEVARAAYGLSFLTDHGQGRKVYHPELDVRFPLYRTPDTAAVLLGALTYRALLGPDGPTHLTGLHGLTGQLALKRRLSASTMLTAAASAGLHSDWRHVSGDAFRYGGGVQVLHRHSARLSYGGGLGVQRQFFGWQLLPVLPVRWALSKRLELSGQLPLRWRLGYQLTPRLNLGGSFGNYTTSYRLSARTDSSHYLQVRQWEMVGLLDYRLRPHWVLWVRAGWLPVQEYATYAAEARAALSIGPFALGNHRTPLVSVSSPGGVAQVGVALRVGAIR